MNVLSALKTKKLNLQNTCTSYYDFLTCGHDCLDSLNCHTLQPDPPAHEEPEGIARRGLKYFDVNDKATEWYLKTRKATSERTPFKKKICFRFRVPVRHALRRKNKAATYSLPGRRVSPEFLSLLKQHHARLKGFEHLPRKYLSLRPSFSYYKYDALAKRRHMRFGIETAAPLEFPCTNINCKRHFKPSPCPQKENVRPSSQDDSTSQAKPKRISLFTSNKSSSGKRRSYSLVSEEQHDDYLLLDNNQQEKRSTLHGIYASNHSLLPSVASKSQYSLKPASQPNHIIASRSQSNLKPMEKIMTCPCPIDLPKWLPRSCNLTIFPNKNVKFKKDRDPRSIEYENRPFFKAIEGNKCVCGAANKKPRSCSKSYQENEFCSYPSQDDCKIQPETPENTFYTSISSHRSLCVVKSERPKIYDQSDIEMPPNRKEVSTGYKGFVHRSENQKIIDQTGGPIRKCKRKKPPPYCYLWSAVDPDIRGSEKQRLAKHKCHQRKLFPESKPYSYFWSKTCPDVRKQAKRRLRESDTESPISQIRFQIPNNNNSHQKEETCSCSRASANHFDEQHSRRSFLYNYSNSDTSNRKKQLTESSVVWEDEVHPTPKRNHKCSRMFFSKLNRDSDTHVHKKPRLLPKLHAFAKRFFSTSPKALHFKSNQSGSERPMNSALSEESSAGISKRLETSFNARERCKDEEVHRNIPSGIQSLRGPRDLKIWTKHSSSFEYRESNSKRQRKPKRLTKSSNFFGSERFTYKRRDSRSNSCSEQPSCSRGPSKFKNYQRSPTRKTSRCERSVSCDSCSSTFSGQSIRHDPTQQYSCQVPQPRVSRAQREWEEEKQKRAIKQRYLCRPCTDYLLTSHRTEPRYPDIRRGIITYQNYELSAHQSDSGLNPSKGNRCQLAQYCPKHKNLKHISRSRSRRHYVQCCDDSDASGHSKSFSGSSRMRGGIDFSSRSPRYTGHRFPTSLSSKIGGIKKTSYTRLSKSPKHLFCFD